ncbi:MAG: hypothetical protein EA396_06870 [Anaerolineaceae bacterium]|nr:MAG: hypothetical protein EA396_06870 [Anaerolineaceae bacterium]
MIQRLLGTMPAWATSDHPVLRSHREAKRGKSGGRYTRIAGALLSLVILSFIGYGAASDFFTHDPLDLPISEMLTRGLLYPVYMVQIVMVGVVLMSTIGMIGHYQRRGLWDTVRATSHGAGLTLRTRWAHLLFYRLRGSLAAIMGGRLVLIAALLYDLTAFQGEYLRSLTGGITPDVAPVAAVILLALTMAAVLLLPVTTLGLDAALGLLLATYIKRRAYVALAQITIITVRVMVSLALLLMFSTLSTAPLDSGGWLAWVLVFAFAALGDWGFSLLYLGFYGAEVWRDIPYGVLIGAALMGYVLLQALLADALLGYATRRAERAD